MPRSVAQAVFYIRRAGQWARKLEQAHSQADQQQTLTIFCSVCGPHGRRRNRAFIVRNLIHVYLDAMQTYQ